VVHNMTVRAAWYHCNNVATGGIRNGRPHGRLRGRGCSRSCGRDLPDDEDFFPRLDKTELPSRDFLDGCRVFLQPAGFLPHARVLGSLTRECGCQLIVLVPRPEHGQQASLADESIDHNQGGDKQQQPPHDGSIAGGLRRGRGFPFARGFGYHVSRTLQHL